MSSKIHPQQVDFDQSEEFQHHEIGRSVAEIFLSIEKLQDPFLGQVNRRVPQTENRMGPPKRKLLCSQIPNSHQLIQDLAFSFGAAKAGE